ncbi:MAG: hypothetical protein JWP75_248 [Frondihabitans sp.]|nr:hypothetical protein [Frondihabitans sp.]
MEQLAVPILVVVAAMLRHSRTWYLGSLWHGARRRTPEEELERTRGSV